MKFGISKVCSAFEDQAIGSRVLNRGDFLAALEVAVRDHEKKLGRITGQYTVAMPESVNSLVSSGVGLCAGVTPDDFVLREHRGRVSAYLRRDRAIQAHHFDVEVIVYTMESYLGDPEVDPSEFSGFEATHVIVAVNAGSSPHTPLRFVSNLAGGNREAALWDIDEILDKAKEVNDYWKKWRVVAD